MFAFERLVALILLAEYGFVALSSRGPAGSRSVMNLARVVVVGAWRLAFFQSTAL